MQSSLPSSLPRNTRRGLTPALAIVSTALAFLLPGAIAAADRSGSVRPAALAGSWYPESRALATSEVHRLLRAAAQAPRPPGRLRALVVPHAGWRYSGVAAASAFRLLEPGAFDRVVLMAPSHHGSFSGFSIPRHRAYATPLGEVPVCGDAAASLLDGKLVRSVPGVHDREHAVEIELPILQETLRSFCLVPILAGTTTAKTQRAMARKLAGLDDGRTLFVFSSDFTHYGPRFGFTPFGAKAPPARERIRALDERAIRLLETRDSAGFRSYLEETRATICGRHGLAVLLELLPLIEKNTAATRLADYASIDLPGLSDSNSVSYAAIAFSSGAKEEEKKKKAPPLGPPHEPAICPPGEGTLDEELARSLVSLARATIESELRGGSELSAVLAAFPDDLPALDRMHAVFVTLNRRDPAEIRTKGRLRGCIGQIFPSYPLHQAVVVAAVSAALNDHRFSPVEAGELDGLEVELTILSPPRAVASWRDIKLGAHGIVLEKSGGRAVFLPQVPGEQGWDLPETLRHLSRKAGLREDAWREGASFQVFTGQVVHEVAFPTGVH